MKCEIESDLDAIDTLNEATSTIHGIGEMVSALSDCGSEPERSFGVISDLLFGYSDIIETVSDYLNKKRMNSMS